MQKAFNLGAGGIGSLIALIPWTIAKAIEFFIPVLAPYLSQGITFLSSLIGAGSMLLIAIPLFPVIYTIERIGTLYDLTCLKCRDLIAIIYGKCNEKLYSTNSKEDIPNETVHSKEFRAKVEEVKKTPWTDLLFGVVKEDNQSTETIYFDHLVVGSGTLYPTLQPRDDVAAPGNPTFNFASK